MKKRRIALTLLLPAMLAVAEPEAGENKTEESQAATPEELVTRVKELEERDEKNPGSVRREELDSLVKQQGRAYKRLLIEKFRQADHITITEVSDPHDSMFAEGIAPGEEPSYEYSTVRLTDAQRKIALDALEALDATTTRVAYGCVFSPHHRMDLTGPDGQVSKMRICFECKVSSWNGSLGLMHPDALNETLGFIVESIGLEKKRDWPKMLQERHEKEAEKTSDKQAPAK